MIIIKLTLYWSGEVRRTKEGEREREIDCGHLFVDDFQIQQQILTADPGPRVTRALSLTFHFYTASRLPEWSWWSGSLWSLLSCMAAWPDCQRREVSSEVCRSQRWLASGAPGCLWWCWGWRGPWRRTTAARCRWSTVTAGSGFSSLMIFFDPGDGDDSKQCNAILWPHKIKCKVLQTSVRLRWCWRITLCLSSTT